MDKTELFHDLCLKMNRKTIVSPTNDVPIPSISKSRDPFLNSCYKLISSLQSLQQYLSRESPKYLYFDNFTDQIRMTSEERDQMDKYLRESLWDISRSRQQLKNLSKPSITTIQNEEHKNHIESIINYIDLTHKQLDNAAIHLRRSRKNYEKQIRECSYILKARKINAERGDIPVTQSTMEIPQLNEEQTEQLSQENKLLQERLFKFDSQLENLYKQVTEIQSLTEQFAQQASTEGEKLKGLMDIEEEAQIHLTEGIKNLQALKTSSKDLRLFVVTLLLFYSFSLVFLHWINP